jgi:hypothetical protein
MFGVRRCQNRDGPTRIVEFFCGRDAYPSPCPRPKPNRLLRGIEWLAFRGDIADVLRTKIRVALELIPRLVQRELSHFVDLIAALESSARGLMPKVMEAKIGDSQNFARTRECCAERRGSYGKT